MARVAFLTMDAIFVSWLGSNALAAASIVFPLLLLIQTASASGVGAGVAASIGRALGAGDPESAGRLAGTAVALALIASAATATTLLLFGPTLYRMMGATGSTRDLTVDYGAVVFGGIGFVWLMNILANISRGSGNMRVPAFSIVAGEMCHLLLSPTLILGWGGFPQLGIVGAAVGALSAYALGAVITACYLCSRRALVRIEVARIRIATAETRTILAIGAPAAASVLIFWATTVVITGLVGQLGSVAIAAYGVATRLETLQYPLIFAFGSSIVTTVATAIGAGDRIRAQLIARTGCGIAAVIAAPFSMIAIVGDSWMSLFTSDVTIRATGALYLACQAVVFPIFNAGLTAVWACYGANVARPALVVSLTRFTVAVGGGWMMLAFSGRALPLFLAVAAGGGVYGLGMLVILYHCLRRRAAE